MGFEGPCQYFREKFCLPKDAPFEALQKYVKVILGTQKNECVIAKKR